MSAPGVEPGSTGKSRTVRCAATSTTTASTSDIPITSLCQNGLHLRTPDNLLVNSRGNAQCKACRYAADLRYINSPRGKVVRSRRDAKYKASLNGYLTRRANDLRKQRAIIVEKLSRLTAEEV